MAVSYTHLDVYKRQGCRERPLGALGIPGTRPAGIYTAGTAQRLVNMEGYMPGNKVVILGSGEDVYKRQSLMCPMHLGQCS